MVRIVSVVGARPQFIKLAPVCRAMRRVEGLRHEVVHTGQHYDQAMSDSFFRELDLPEPAHNLGVGSGTHGAQTARILERIEPVLLDARPEACLVYGDTNSTLAAALAAVKLHIPVFHVEAGLRSHNRRMPEEINRIAVDHIADVLLCPCKRAMEMLRAEGLTENAHFVGDVMYDAVLQTCPEPARADAILARFGLKRRAYYLATAHRPRNTDDPGRLRAILGAFDRLPRPVVFPAHPRTRKALAAAGVEPGPNVRVLEPVGYLEMLALLRGAKALLTDSGGMQKEAFFLATPCITLREETEWGETVDAGWNRLVGAEPQAIAAAAQEVEATDWDARAADRPEPYGDGRAAEKIVEVVRARVTELAS